MYIPTHFAADDTVVGELLSAHGAADLVTATPAGLRSTLLPFLYDPAVGEHGTIAAHLARNNDQWSHEVLGEALMIIRGPDAYISPTWYPSTAEHGRVVPTWNYLTAHVYGTLVVHDDPAWVDAHVRRLTGKHEVPGGWSVDDAPAAFIAGQVRAIVGVELIISRVEAKAKASQNRQPADVEGVIAGLTALGDTASAQAVRRARDHPGGSHQPGG